MRSMVASWRSWLRLFWGALGGGKGTILGCILGVMFVAITQNGLNLLGVSPFAFQMIIGAAILIAISTSNIDLSLRPRRKEARS